MKKKMEKLLFSNHALTRFAQRNIKEKEIELALKYGTRYEVVKLFLFLYARKIYPKNWQDHTGKEWAELSLFKEYEIQLMLLKGTKLYKQKQMYGFREKTVGEYQIPVVVAGNTFTENEWFQMNKMAEELAMSVRYL